MHPNQLENLVKYRFGFNRSVILHISHTLGDIDTGGLWTTLSGGVTALSSFKGKWNIFCIYYQLPAQFWPMAGDSYIFAELQQKGQGCWDIPFLKKIYY